MSTQTSIEETVDLSAVRLGRNRALALLGGLLFTTALRVVFPEAADATHLSPYPCSSALGRCHCCTGCQGYTAAETCFAGGSYWFVCNCGTEWKCSDWVRDATQEFCTCNEQWGSCGGGC